MTWLLELRAEQEKSRQELVAVVRDTESRIVDRVHRLETDLRKDIQQVEVRLTERIAGVQNNLMKWSFLFWVGAVAAIAALAGVLRQ